MDLQRIADGADRFAAYVEELTGVIGHADRAAPLRDYCTGLLAAEGRRSVEPMAAVTAPARVSAQHQKLLHFVGEGAWSDEEVLVKIDEPHMYNADDAVARIDSYIVSVTGGGRFSVDGPTSQQLPCQQPRRRRIEAGLAS